MTNSDTVRAFLDAYQAQDRGTADQLMSDDFVFTSPQDDQIDKAAFMERCFPTADRFRSSEILRLVAVDDENVFVLYQYELMQDREVYRNCELITVRNGRPVETQVFFGGRVPV